MVIISSGHKRPRWWYAACRRCTAKWFARQRMRHCIRCGADVLAVPAVRPWNKSGRQRKFPAEEQADKPA